MTVDTSQPSQPAPGEPPAPAKGVYRSAATAIAIAWSLRLIGLISVLVLARVLTPRDFGIVALATSVLALVDIFSALGLRQALLRIATPEAKCAFLFTRVGLAGCDMGACAMLPRIIGQGRAAELLYTGRAMSAEEGLSWGYWNALHSADELDAKAREMASRIASGPTWANMMTKTQLNQEWNLSLDQAIEAEAQAQAICMQGKDFERAYHAFVAKEKPVFAGD